MRKKLIYGLLAGSVLAAMLTGCGDGSEEGTAGTSSEVAVISPEPALSDTEREAMRICFSDMRRNTDIRLT